MLINRKELKSHLDKMEKKRLVDMVLDINAQFPAVRKFIGDMVSPPTIDWKQLYDECREYVIKASLSNKINRIPVPGAADIMVKGIIFAKTPTRSI